MRYLFTVVIIVSLLTVGCDDRPKLQEPIILDDVSYSIIDSSTLPVIKRSLDVRLNKKVSEKTLRAIALKLKSQDSRDHDCTFITYYLPGMTVGAGAWATTHFNPDLEVRILGLTAEEEERLVGRWFAESPYVSIHITIFREDGKLFIDPMFKDGSSLKEELVEKKSPLGRRFDPVEGTSTGDYLVLCSDGNLQVRDNDGLIATLRKIE